MRQCEYLSRRFHHTSLEKPATPISLYRPGFRYTQMGHIVNQGSEAMKNDQEQTPQPLLLTIPQAAQCLGLSRAKLYSLIAQEGGPPVVRFGRSVRIPVASLKSWLQQYEEQQREH